LPGATRTEYWSVAGVPIEAVEERGIVMSAEQMVDASLVGFDQGELATIPSLPDYADWQAFESARTALGPNLSRTAPAARFNVA
jgi:short-subunit dehydrogenase